MQASKAEDDEREHQRLAADPRPGPWRDPRAGGRRASFRDVVATHPLLTVVVCAALVRVVAAVVSFVVNDHVAVPDEGVYLDIARGLADGSGADAYRPGYGQATYESYWLFVAPLVALAEVFGPSRLPPQLFVVAFGVLTALLTTVLARQVVSGPAALTAGLITALVPSQVLWSSLVLREAPAWAALALVACCLVLAVTASGSRLALATLGVAGGLLALGWLRPQTLVAAAWALPVAVLLAPGAKARAARVLGALILAAVIPVFAGLGIGGWNLVHAATPVLGQTRTMMGMDASSGFGPVETPSVPVEQPDVPAAQAATGSPAEAKSDNRAGALGIAQRRVPKVGSEGALTGGDGVVVAFDDSAAANLTHLPRGVVASLFRPAVGEDVSSDTARLASIENLLWYVLYVLAAIGLWRGGGKARRLLAFPIVCTVLLVGQFALTHGNLGTAFRHRGQLLWAISIFAALGLHDLHRSWRRRQPPALSG